MKRLIIFLSILISVINTYAYDIEIDGLRYNVTSLTELTASFVGVADKYPEEGVMGTGTLVRYLSRISGTCPYESDGITINSQRLNFLFLQACGL